MTGIERLRGVAGFWRENKLADIADQIERELTCDKDAIENIRLIVGGVVDEMERHILGHEGMEDSPVARWARELSEALGGEKHDPAADVSMSAYDLLPQEDRDAIAWVREHGGLDHVRGEWRSRVPYDRYERRRQRLLGHIAECEAALGLRREIISELNHRACDLTRENAELRKRTMPEGYEWPRFESGEQVMLGDSVVKYVGGGEFEVRSVEFRDGVAYLREGFRTAGIVIVRPGERVRRPSKVLDADGVEIRVGDTVCGTQDLEPMRVVDADSRECGFKRIKCEKEGNGFFFYCADELTHKLPVLAADGKPLREGETVWYRDHTDPLEVRGISTTDSGAHYVKAYNDYEGEVSAPAKCFTHERPDSFEQLEKDANDLIYDISFRFGDYSPRDFKEKGDSVQDRVRDLVRRAKKLAGVGE